MLDDDLKVTLRLEFVDSCDDRLAEMEQILEACAEGRRKEADTLQSIRRASHSIKGTAASLGFPFVATLAHRLEDFLEGETRCPAPVMRAISQYMDAIRSQVERPNYVPRTEEAVSILRGLPSRMTLQDLNIELRDVEALLVIPSDTIAKIVRKELAACGIRAVRAVNAMDGFQLAVRSAPDLMVFSQTLDELSGADLIKALRVMAPTAHIPTALLTSFARDNPLFAGLPDTVTVIRSGAPHFAEDMGDFLATIDALLG